MWESVNGRWGNIAWEIDSKGQHINSCRKVNYNNWLLVENESEMLLKTLKKIQLHDVLFYKLTHYNIKIF